MHGSIFTAMVAIYTCMVQLRDCCGTQHADCFLFNLLWCPAGETYQFAANAWLDKKNGRSRTLTPVQQPGAQQSRGLPQQQLQQPTQQWQQPAQQQLLLQQPQAPQQPQNAGSQQAAFPGYQITLETKDKACGNLKGRVFFELRGERGSSGAQCAVPSGSRSSSLVHCNGDGAEQQQASKLPPICLPLSLTIISNTHTPPSMHPAEVIVPGPDQADYVKHSIIKLLYPHLPSLGELTSLRVGFKPPAGLLPSSWRLGSVEALHIPTGRRWQFYCLGWIDKKCGYEVTLAATRQ